MLLQMRSDPDVATNIGCAVSWSMEGGEDFSILRHGYLLGMNLPVTGVFCIFSREFHPKPFFATFTELGGRSNL